MELSGRRIVVVGMGRSGRAAAELARDLGAEVRGLDRREDAEFPEGVEGRTGEHRPDDLLGADLVVLSPGVPADLPAVAAAEAAGVPVLGEPGFALAALGDAAPPVVGVTGTNGKSSVTWFCGQLLEGAGLRAWVGGNIGRPASLLARRLRLEGRRDVDVAVLELSSYQLERPGPLAPRAGAVLNLTPDHLGRHGTMEAYASAKLRMFARCGPGDAAVLPADHPLLPAERVRRGGAGPRVLRFGGRPGVEVVGDRVWLDWTEGRAELDARALRPPGAHNRENAGVAALLAVLAGAPPDALDLARLVPLAHRLEPVGRAAGALWVDDSKATNVEAALVGLRAFDGPLVALLGGRGKAGADYAALRPALARRARAVVCFGEAGPAIAEALEGLPVERARGLREAVERAAALARPGDVVLLSPACASFDEFGNFEERGRAFRAWVRALEGA